MPGKGSKLNVRSPMLRNTAGAATPLAAVISSAVTIHIDQGDRAGAAEDAKLLPGKGQATLVPQNRKRVGQIAQHYVFVAVTVQIVDGQTAAVAVEEAGNRQCRLRRVREVVGDKRVQNTGSRAVTG